MLRWITDLIVTSTRLRSAHTCRGCGAKMTLRTTSAQAYIRIRSMWRDWHRECGPDVD